MRYLVVLILIIAPCLSSQEKDGYAPFQEESYITYPIENDILFEGQIAPAYPVFDWKNRKGSVGVNVVLTPKVVLKMYRTRSNPVKTPSYMPRIAIQTYMKGQGFDVYPFLMLSHHSNGQGGTTFIEENSSSDESLLNTESGSFSTNFFRTGYYFSLKSFPDHYVGLSYEHHPVHGWWFSIDPAIKDIYGRKRTNYEYKYLGKLLQMEVFHTRIHDKKDKTRDITGATAKLRLPVVKMPVWLFAGYYQGQDYYNIYFEENVHRFKMGLSVQTKLSIK